MMSIGVYGPQHGNVKPTTLGRTMHKFATEAGYVLGLNQTDAKVDIDIILGTARMEQKLLDKDIGGYCAAFYDDDEDRYEVEIELARLRNSEELFLNLSHEMIHCKQYVKNELGTMFDIIEDGFNITSAWKGKKWVANKNQDPYFDSPWEIEAYAEEEELYQTVLGNLAAGAKI